MTKIHDMKTFIRANLKLAIAIALFLLMRI